MASNELILFESQDKSISLNVPVRNDSGNRLCSENAISIQRIVLLKADGGSVGFFSPFP